MSLEPRLNLLKESGFLSEKNYDYVKDFIGFFEEELGAQLTEENGASLITHICAALERISKNELVSPLDEEVYELSKEEPTFHRANDISLKLRGIYPFIPQEEVQYITMHLGTLLAGED